MKYFSRDNDRNEKLKKGRNVSFEDVVFYIEKGHLLDIIKNPNNEKYRDRRIFIVEVDNYAYLVPFVESEREILKTIIPSRKATRKYLRKGNPNA